MKYTLTIITIVIINLSLQAQYSQLQLGDTTKPEYPYHLPILGEAAYDNGFDIPYPVGIMTNYFFAVQDMEIPEIAVGFSDGLFPTVPLTDITRIIEFEEIRSSVHSVNVRPDVWIFPFLNVYGIFGKAYSETKIKLSYPFELEAIAKLQGASYGLGTTGAFGLGKLFVVADGNWVWTNMDNFENPVKSSVFSFRIGKAFKFKKHKEMNIAVWAGGMRVRMGNITQGTIQLSDILSDETRIRRDEIVEDYNIWYNGLNDLDPRKAIAEKILSPIINNIGEADGAGTIEYKLSKKPNQEWNVILGGQFQINKHWQIRSEAGLIANRKSALLSVNYRFGFRKRGFKEKETESN